MGRGVSKRLAVTIFLSSKNIKIVSIIDYIGEITYKIRIFFKLQICDALLNSLCI